MLVLCPANFDLKSICLMFFSFFFSLHPLHWPTLRSVDSEVRLHTGLWEGACVGISFVGVGKMTEVTFNYGGACVS